MATQPTATQFLRDQHKILRGLFRQFEPIDHRAPEMKQGVVKEILMMIEVHFSLEEEFIYQPLMEAASDEDRVLAGECLRDHAAIRALVKVMRKKSVQEEFFNTGFLNLLQTTDEHLVREDEELFSAAERTLGSLLDEMGPRMQERRDQLVSSPLYRDARPEIVQNPHGGEQMRKRSA